MVDFLIDAIFLSTEIKASQVNATWIVVRRQSGKPRVAILGVCRYENQGYSLDHFQEVLIMQGEQQFAIRIILDNL